LYYNNKLLYVKLGLLSKYSETDGDFGDLPEKELADLKEDDDDAQPTLDHELTSPIFISRDPVLAPGLLPSCADVSEELESDYIFHLF